MIVIAGNGAAAFDESKLSGLELAIYHKKKNSAVEYRYESIDALLFELHMRTRIVESARSLNKSGASFAGFAKSRCNEAFWQRTEYGGFRLKSGVAPQDAIRDIFANGRLYAFECATAMVIVLYKAVLDSIDPKQFDVLFSNLLLFDWQYDSDLRLIDRKQTKEAVAGDVLYLENPEFSPTTPWWRGENVIKLENDLYYGHGIGIAPMETFVAVLNKFRKPGSTKSAFLTDDFTHPDFSYLRRFQSGVREKPVIAKVGARTYVY
jgi:protein-glutamine gamma-glutamyltransferase